MTKSTDTTSKNVALFNIYLFFYKIYATEWSVERDRSSSAGFVFQSFDTLDRSSFRNINCLIIKLRFARFDSLSNGFATMGYPWDDGVHLNYLANMIFNKLIVSPGIRKSLRFVYVYIISVIKVTIAHILLNKKVNILSENIYLRYNIWNRYRVNINTLKTSYKKKYWMIDKILVSRRENDRQWLFQSKKVKLTIKRPTLNTEIASRDGKRDLDSF